LIAVGILIAIPLAARVFGWGWRRVHDRWLARQARGFLILTYDDGPNRPEKTVTIVVLADNDPPTFADGLVQTAQVRQRVVLDAKASDPEERPLRYTWTQIDGPQVRLSGTNVPHPSFTAPDSSCKLGFEVTVSDGEREEKAELTVSVQETSVK